MVWNSPYGFHGLFHGIHMEWYGTVHMDSMDYSMDSIWNGAGDLPGVVLNGGRVFVRWWGFRAMGMGVFKRDGGSLQVSTTPLSFLFTPLPLLTRRCRCCSPCHCCSPCRCCSPCCCCLTRRCRCRSTRCRRCRLACRCRCCSTQRCGCSSAALIVGPGSSPVVGGWGVHDDAAVVAALVNMVTRRCSSMWW